MPADTNEPKPPTRAPRGTHKHPMDFTGVEGERLAKQNADPIAAAAETMAMARPVARKRKREVHDYTFANESKAEVLPVTVPELPQEHTVRIKADITDMTFSRKIYDEGDFSDPLNPVMPIVGPLRHLSFNEGEWYKIDEGLYQHLVRLGYIDPDEDEE
jgi:uncharacterized protein (DUF4415 family)